MSDEPDQDPTSEDDEAPAWGLVMPFVTVASVGGPHDDEAYVAGYEMGGLAVRLEMAAASPLCGELGPVTVRSVSVEQLDLIAMRFGFVVVPERTTLASFAGWSTVRLKRLPA